MPASISGPVFFGNNAQTVTITQIVATGYGSPPTAAFNVATFVPYKAAATIPKSARPHQFITTKKINQTESNHKLIPRIAAGRSDAPVAKYNVASKAGCTGALYKSGCVAPSGCNASDNGRRTLVEKFPVVANCLATCA